MRRVLGLLLLLALIALPWVLFLTSGRSFEPYGYFPLLSADMAHALGVVGLAIEGAVFLLAWLGLSIHLIVKR